MNKQTKTYGKNLVVLVCLTRPTMKANNEEINIMFNGYMNIKFGSTKGVTGNAAPIVKKAFASAPPQPPR